MAIELVQQPVHVEVEDDGGVVVVMEEHVQTLEIAQGIKGERGEQGVTGQDGVDGIGDATFPFSQGIPSATWTINHNLGKYPSVTVKDIAGDEVEAEVQFASLNQVVIKFGSAMIGEAHLN